MPTAIGADSKSLSGECWQPGSGSDGGAGEHGLNAAHHLAVIVRLDQQQAVPVEAALAAAETIPPEVSSTRMSGRLRAPSAPG